MRTKKALAEKQLPTTNDSSLESIDSAFLKYIEDLNINVKTSNGLTPVPVIWGSAERSYQIKNNILLRDENGSLIPPIISIERSSFSKDPSDKGAFQANVAGTVDYYYSTKEVNQAESNKHATSDLSKMPNAVKFLGVKKNKKVVYETTKIAVPVYITIQYKINLLVSYQSQLNEIFQFFAARTGQNYFVITDDKHRYECFMEKEFNQEATNDLGEEERKYKADINVKVLGYLTSEGPNQARPNKKKEQNPVEVKADEIALSATQKITQEETGQSNQVGNYGSGIAIVGGLGDFVTKRIFYIGNNRDSLYNIKHGFNSKDLYVSVRANNTTADIVYAGISYSDMNNIIVDVGEVATLKQYIVTIIG